MLCLLASLRTVFRIEAILSNLFVRTGVSGNRDLWCMDVPEAPYLGRCRDKCVDGAAAHGVWEASVARVSVFLSAARPAADGRLYGSGVAKAVTPVLNVNKQDLKCVVHTGIPSFRTRFINDSRRHKFQEHLNNIKHCLFIYLFRGMR
jgi:hypothetical protein